MRDLTKDKEPAKIIRQVGETLIKNAESIAGSELYRRSITINIEINLAEELPVVNVTRSFYPERSVEEQ